MKRAQKSAAQADPRIKSGDGPERRRDSLSDSIELLIDGDQSVPAIARPRHLREGGRFLREF